MIKSSRRPVTAGSRRSLRLAAGVAAALVIGATTAALARGSLFDDISGTWSGSGTAVVAGGSPEPIRCRASYAAAGDARLHLGLRCASDSFNLQVSSDITRTGDRISGEWNETATGVSGEVRGSVSGSQLAAAISGAGIDARLSLAVRGNAQSVTLSSSGPISATASVVLRRS